MSDCIFCKIRDGSIPSAKLFEDDTCFVIRDIAPKAPTHLLVISKAHVASVPALCTEATQTDEQKEALLGHFIAVADRQARALGLDEYRLVANGGASSGQVVFHLHWHVLGGKKLQGEFG